ncbi:MAG: polyribonucleotide nucleotidyltransferase [Melioribacteraceae bacterium]|nr:polyribonucleotide nucleotidyltransferase [Melioribacteraceae bacterium]MCF8263971.1 polyribonucleotide nucleotidyltransferase [Melioribacteraceae bacterium]
MVYTKEVEVGGKIISIEYGRYARQSNAAVMVRCGDTMVFVAVTAAAEAREGIDFFPLSVEYREKAFAAGKFPGGFFKREGKPTEKEVLSSRLIDRPIRPLFAKGFQNETQIIASVYSFDGDNDGDVLAAIGASAALTISDIPFLEPIAEVRVGRINGEFIVNPTHKEIAESDIELTVAGTESSIMMVEGESTEVSEADLLEALKIAHVDIKKIVAMQNEFRAECGKEKMVVQPAEIDSELLNAVNELAHDKYKELVSTVLAKKERSQKNSELNAEVLAALEEKFPDQESTIKTILHDLEKDLMRKQILENGNRLDGRNTTEIRPITIEVGILPRVHGSALFTRGETQSLTTLTLGTKSDEQIIDGLMEEYKKRFILHYNFPPFSVGETGRFGFTGRREIGHGNLAERALKCMMPEESKFPYSIRINSDILESNGSSSMATVCAGSLALMDGGAPIESGIAGIAMGLIKEDDSFAVLSDISGNEDHLGDMDFKVAGTEKGITAFQMDIKIQGISYEIMEKALAQAKEGRTHILAKMAEALPASRESISTHAPTLLFTKVKVEKIGAVIGPGGKVIQGIQKEFGVDVSIEDDGTVNIAGNNKEMAQKAKEYIKLLVAEPEVGKTYNAVIKKVADFGAFAEFMPGNQGLIHISQLDIKRVDKVSDVVKEGDEIRVKLIKIDDQGRKNLSRKAVMEAELKNENNSEVTENPEN